MGNQPSVLEVWEDLGLVQGSTSKSAQGGRGKSNTESKTEAATTNGNELKQPMPASQDSSANVGSTSKSANDAGASPGAGTNSGPKKHQNKPHASSPSPAKLLSAFLRLLRGANVNEILSAATLDQLDELNRVLCRPVLTELERKLSKIANEMQPTVQLLLAGSANGTDGTGVTHDDGGLYDGGVISELLGPEGHKAVIHKTVGWAITVASYRPAFGQLAAASGEDVADELRRVLCCAGFIQGIGVDRMSRKQKNTGGTGAVAGDDADSRSASPDASSLGSSNPPSPSNTKTKKSRKKKKGRKSTATLASRGSLRDLDDFTKKKRGGAMEVKLSNKPAISVLNHGCLQRLRGLGRYLEEAHFKRRNLGDIIGSYVPLIAGRQLQSIKEGDGKAEVSGDADADANADAGASSGSDEPAGGSYGGETGAQQGSDVGSNGTRTLAQPTDSQNGITTGQEVAEQGETKEGELQTSFVPIVEGDEEMVIRQFVPPEGSAESAGGDEVEGFALECVYIHFNRLVALALEDAFQVRIGLMLGFWFGSEITATSTVKINDSRGGDVFGLLLHCCLI